VFILDATGGAAVFVTTPVLGDINDDGEIDGLDVDPFVEVLLSGPYQAEADMNGDQVVNGLDVDPFVAAVVGGVQHIPEPSTLLLAIVAAGVVGAWRRWGGGESNDGAQHAHLRRRPRRTPHTPPRGLVPVARKIRRLIEMTCSSSTPTSLSRAVKQIQLLLRFNLTPKVNQAVG
jgi:hypothetical protein